MANLARFGISLDSDLLEQFDKLIGKKGYTNRSEALRDLIRDQLVAEEWRTGNEEAVAVVTLVYDHHQLDLPKRLTDAQHDHHGLVNSSLHVHLDRHSCLEVLILRGRAAKIKALGEKLASTRGVKHAKVTHTTTARTLR